MDFIASPGQLSKTLSQNNSVRIRTLRYNLVVGRLHKCGALGLIPFTTERKERNQVMGG